MASVTDRLAALEIARNALKKEEKKLMAKQARSHASRVAIEAGLEFARSQKRQFEAKIENLTTAKAAETDATKATLIGEKIKIVTKMKTAAEKQVVATEKKLVVFEAERIEYDEQLVEVYKQLVALDDGAEAVVKETADEVGSDEPAVMAVAVAEDGDVVHFPEYPEIHAGDKHRAAWAPGDDEDGEVSDSD